MTRRLFAMLKERKVFWETAWQDVPGFEEGAGYAAVQSGSQEESSWDRKASAVVRF